MREYKVTARGNDGFLYGIWYFPTEAEANRWTRGLKAKGWHIEIEIID